MTHLYSKNPEIQARVSKEKYEDFYQRAFMDADIDAILEAGGGLNYNNFVIASKNNIKDSDYHKAMVQCRLGGEIFKRYFAQEGFQAIQTPRGQRIQIKKGYSYELEGKKYKAGQFAPKQLYKKR